MLLVAYRHCRDYGRDIESMGYMVVVERKDCKGMDYLMVVVERRDCKGMGYMMAIVERSDIVGMAWVFSYLTLFFEPLRLREKEKVSLVVSLPHFEMHFELLLLFLLLLVIFEFELHHLDFE